MRHIKRETPFINPPRAWLTRRNSCPNADDKSKADRAIWYVRKWANIYLKDAQTRLAPQLKGYDLSIEDVYTLQQMCAYEVCLAFSTPPLINSTNSWP